MSTNCNTYYLSHIFICPMIQSFRYFMCQIYIDHSFIAEPCVRCCESMSSHIRGLSQAGRMGSLFKWHHLKCGEKWWSEGFTDSNRGRETLRRESHCCLKAGPFEAQDIWTGTCSCFHRQGRLHCKNWKITRYQLRGISWTLGPVAFLSSSLTLDMR